MNPMYRILFITLVAVAAACSHTDSRHSMSEQELADELVSLEQQIAELTRTASCESVAECRAVALGKKPCGGPARYIVYSTTDTDPGLMERLSTSHQARSKELNDLTGAMSDCMLVVEPELACVASHCAVK